MKRIRINANYDKSENLVDRLIKQFKTEEIDLSNIEFVYDNSYDYCVCFNHISVEILPNKHYYIFPHEPPWTGTHQKNYPENSTVFGFEKRFYQGNCIETLAHTFYGGRGPWVDKLDFWNYSNLKNKEFTKTKTISSIITTLNSTSGLYKKRYKLLTELLTLPNIDFYGCSSLNKINTLPNPTKYDNTVPYKFSICIENDNCKNWITEKFYDAILTDTIPIYYGCDNIKSVYPEDGYILLDNIDDINYIKDKIEYVINNADIIYNEKLPYARQIKEKYFKQYNLLNKIISLNP
jgi:hypothetical protein